MRCVRQVYSIAACISAVLSFDRLDTKDYATWDALLPDGTQQNVGPNPHGAQAYSAAPLTAGQPPFFNEMLQSLQVMQSRFFELWLGLWPEAIDWTAAVTNTHLLTAVHAVSRSFSYSLHDPSSSTAIPPGTAQIVEDYVNRYFAQSSAFYFGEDIFSVRTQAHDDMLWVVLGWLEALRLVDDHDGKHHSISHGDDAGKGNRNIFQWHAKQFEPPFAHRAHVFYDLVDRAWDTSLCGGGLTWNPRLAVYKNTITNTQYIAAAVGMYLYHPGDNNSSPFLSSSSASGPRNHDAAYGPSSLKPHDPKLLKAAVDAYDWLQRVNLTNSHGLYVDGYHVSNHARNHSHGVAQCDLRNEMVYTYNQGVILTGLRGLWEGTGQFRYLDDAHRLVRAVVRATGWPAHAGARTATATWAGLGRAGVLAEFCDPKGSCSQDAQAFKGIFFHHLAFFCQPLPTRKPRVPGGGSYVAEPELAALHRASCREYGEWVAHNARAASRTRDADGVFGMWWRAEDDDQEDDDDDDGWDSFGLPVGAEDYRNKGAEPRDYDNMRNKSDVNDRGRGRTLETQGGGLSVMQAAWELRRL